MEHAESTSLLRNNFDIGGKRMTVQNRVAVVTGSGSGLGEAIAKMLASNGAKVVVNDLDHEKIKRVVSEIKMNDGEAIGIHADVSNPIDVERLIDGTVTEFGTLDILVNNAGITRVKSLIDTTDEDYEKVMDTNLRAIFLTSKAAAPQMIKQQHGRIINISSRAWLGVPEQSIYAASKAGVIGFTRTLALELAKHQITSNVICPGVVETPSFRSIPEELQKELKSIQLTGNIGQPEDIANGVLFFAADESSFVTGQTIFICGGKSLFQSLSV